MKYEIPTEGHLPFIDAVIPIHWDNHAILMFGIWFLLIPIAVIFLRFGKIKPSTYGIKPGTSKWAWPELCWTIHKLSLYIAIFFALGGVAFAMLLSGGFSGTLHAWFGIGTVTLGSLQIASSWFRGSHGGRKAHGVDTEDRTTWGGDHFDMKPQRRWFEAYHKTAGYFSLLLAMGAVASGLSQFWMASIALALIAVVFCALVAAIILQGRGHNHDTYQSVYGTHPDHPFNQQRHRQMMDAKGEKP
jgi:hypothetical protein